MRPRLTESQVFYSLAAIAAAPFLPARWLPMVDLPQHELVADALRRHLVGASLVATDSNYFTYNAGFELAVTALSPVLDVVHASRMVMALGAFGLVAALGRFRVLLGLERWPALLGSLLLLHYSASWGFANFTLGLPLLFVVLGDSIALRNGTLSNVGVARAVMTAVALAMTHVLATLAACTGFALLALPSWLHRPRREGLLPWLRASLPLFAAATYDVGAFLWARAHPHSPWENAWAEGKHAGVLERLRSLASNTLGTSSGLGEPLSLALLGLTLVALAWAHARQVARSRREPSSIAVDAGNAVVSSALPLGFGVLYLVVPTVFVATFYVGERFASLAFLATIAVIPAPRGRSPLRVAVAAVALAATLRLEQTIRASDDAAQDGLAVLAAVPAESSLLPVNRGINVEGFARSPLRHLFSRHALGAGAPVGYSFLRFESPPVRRRLPVNLPDPPAGFEGDGFRLDVNEAWPRAWDVLFVVDDALAGADEASVRSSIAPSCPNDLVLIARRGRFAAYRWARRRTVVTM